jgi:hypothetical protein
MRDDLDFLPGSAPGAWLDAPSPEEAGGPSGSTEPNGTLGSTEPNLPPFVRLDTFLDQPDPPVTYRFDGLWPADGRVLWSAQFKSGKTTGVANVLRSLADGADLFDHYPVSDPGGRIVLLDDELHENTLRRWLRQQHIRNADRIDVVPLRGKLSTFDVMDDRVRAAWARQIADAGAAVVILDCLRPVLDSLGLSEDKDAGRFLVAFDELLTDAQVPEAMVVHHMGHSGERSRGDSRLRDWPDAEWKLVRSGTEGVDDPAAPRYFSAYGRDVDVTEQRLALHDDGRRLYIAGGSRRDAALEDALSALLSVVEERPGMSTRDLREAVPGRAEVVDKARDDALGRGLIEVRQEGRAKRHYRTVSNVSHRVPDTGHIPAGERVPCPIGDTDTSPAVTTPEIGERVPDTVERECVGCGGPADRTSSMGRPWCAPCWDAEAVSP